MQNITSKTTLDFDEMINNMENINLVQLRQEIKYNHPDLVEQLKLFGLAEVKVIDTMVLLQANNEKPDLIHLTKIFKDGKFY